MDLTQFKKHLQQVSKKQNLTESPDKIATSAKALDISMSEFLRSAQNFSKALDQWESLEDAPQIEDFYDEMPRHQHIQGVLETVTEWIKFIQPHVKKIK